MSEDICAPPGALTGGKIGKCKRTAEEMEQLLWKLHLPGIEYGQRGDYKGSFEMFVKMKNLLLEASDVDDDDDGDDDTGKQYGMNKKRKRQWLGAIEGNLCLLQNDFGQTQTQINKKSVRVHAIESSSKKSSKSTSKSAKNKSKSKSPATSASASGQQATAIASSSKNTKKVIRRRESCLQDDVFDERCTMLEDYKAEVGHCCVPKVYRENQRLAYWVYRQRALYRERCKGKQNGLTDERLNRLQKLGFVFVAKNSKTQLEMEASVRKDKKEARWDAGLALLEDYEEQFGNCLVPKRYPPNQALANWVFRQRQEKRIYDNASTSTSTTQKKKSSLLNAARIRKLEGIGFVWNAKASKEWREADQIRKLEQSEFNWQSHFKELVEYKRKHGHTRVPKVYSKDQALSYWVFRQRSMHQRLLKDELYGVLSNRLQQLQGVGFEFSVRALSPMKQKRKSTSTGTFANTKSAKMEDAKKRDEEDGDDDEDGDESSISNNEDEDEDGDGSSVPSDEDEDGYRSSVSTESHTQETSDYITVTHLMHKRAELSTRREATNFSHAKTNVTTTTHALTKSAVGRDDDANNNTDNDDAIKTPKKSFTTRKERASKRNNRRLESSG